MPNIALEDFIGEYRQELIRRCELKVASRVPISNAKAETHHGVPLFLNQLCEQLRNSASDSDEIGESARKHGHDLQLQGFTIEQVVHDYGDVCQSVTDMALEMSTPISTDDFRTLNRCLDNAIAGAVTEFTLEQGVTRDKASAELEHLTDAAIAGFRAIRTGHVGIAGHTARVVEHSLMAIRAHLNAGRPPAEELRN
jgi:hypothetical protein